MTPWQESRLRILEQRLGQARRRIREQQISIFSLEQMALVASSLTVDGAGGDPSVFIPKLACLPCNIPKADLTITINYDTAPSGSGSNTISLPLAYEESAYSVYIDQTVGGTGPYPIPNPHWISPCHIFSDSLYNNSFEFSTFNLRYLRFILACFNGGINLAVFEFDSGFDASPGYQAAATRCANFFDNTQYHRPDQGIYNFGSDPTQPSFFINSSTCNPFDITFGYSTPDAGGGIFFRFFNSLEVTYP
jgi:hypothetical protein